MSDDDIDELREQTRGTDRISAEVGDEDTGGTEGDTVETDTDGATPEETGEGTDEETSEEDLGPTPSDEFGNAFADRARRTEGGIDPRSFSAEDPRLSALLLALQDTGEIEEVGGALCDALGAREPPEYDRDAVVRLALTYALRETAPEYFEELAERT